MPDSSKSFRKHALKGKPSDPQTVNIYSSEEITKLFFDLNVHQVELETQNEELRRVQLELEKERDKYTNLYASSPVGYLTIDRKGSITNANLESAELTGYDRSTLLRMSIFRLLKPDDRTVFLNDSKLMLETKAPHSCELCIQQKNGSTFLALLHISPQCDNTGKVNDLNIAIIDITESRHVQEAREKQHKLESLGVLTGGIAHDFNNMLGGIFGYLELLKELLHRNPEAQSYLQKTFDCIAQARHLTLQLSTFSKGGAPVKQITSIKSIVDEAVTISLSGCNVKCDISFPLDLYYCDVDPGQIVQVITNLLINSRSAMSGGGAVSIKTANKTVTAMHGISDLSEGDYVEIIIADRGTGIPQEALKKVFDPYFTTKKTGSGLGLAIAHSIIRKHGGTIMIASTEGKGTTVTFYLPAARGPVVRAALPLSDNVLGVGNILVMDDELAIREVASGFLKSFGYCVTTTATSDVAVDTYRKALDANIPFDAVILDLTICGGEGGQKTIKRLHDIDPYVKGIAMSGYSDSPVLAHTESYGFIAAIPKPFTKNELGSAVKKALSEKGVVVYSYA